LVSLFDGLCRLLFGVACIHYAQFLCSRSFTFAMLLLLSLIRLCSFHF
jgi:hypothetical protein